MTAIEWPEKYQRTLAVLEFIAKMKGKPVNEYIAEWMHDLTYSFIHDTADAEGGLVDKTLWYMSDDAPEKYGEPEEKKSITIQG